MIKRRVILIFSINPFRRLGRVIADLTMIHDEINRVDINQQNANLAAELQKLGHAVTDDILSVRGESPSNLNNYGLHSLFTQFIIS